MIIFNYGNVIDPLLRGTRKFIRDFADIKAGDRVLDVCCGTGEQVLEYGRNGITATGIDIDPNMLKIAFKNKDKYNLKNVSFKQADATSLPFSNCLFDCASISFGLHDKGRTDRQKIITEMKRVVKPGGSIVFLDFQVPLPANLWALFARTIESFAGGSHYQGFKDYIKIGGINYLIDTNRLREVKRFLFDNGIMVAARLINS